MIKVIKNPEIKKIISQFIITYVLFIIIGTFIINYEIDNYKKMLVFNNTAIIGNIYSNPNLDINKEIKLITKNISEKEYIKGKEVLEKYGYNESIQLELIPLYKDIYINTKSRFIIFTSIFFILFLIIIYINYSRIYFKLDKVIKVSTGFIEGNFSSTLDYLEEGTFSRLNSNFNEMGKRLKMNIDELKNEKVFLKNLLSDISHQLKTPLSSLKVYNDIILSMEEFNKDEVLKLCTYSERQLNRMKYLIESLLKLAKLEAGALEFNLEKESIIHTTLEALEILKGKIREKNISCKIHYDKDIIVLHDSFWTAEALSNIIKNSIEHTEYGGKIDIYFKNNPIFKEIIVKDNGEGILKEDIPHIFERFYKGNKSKKSDSVGIGLALSKSIMQLQSGDIRVKSEENKGTEFIITFLEEVI